MDDSPKMKEKGALAAQTKVPQRFNDAFGSPDNTAEYTVYS
jgi:hypothetical protein